jgi:hypothetical protein
MWVRWSFRPLETELRGALRVMTFTHKGLHHDTDDDDADNMQRDGICLCQVSRDQGAMMRSCHRDVSELLGCKDAIFRGQ